MEYNIYTIRKLISYNRIEWSGHILKKMQQRNIKIKDVLKTIENGRIIEDYEYDKPFPSCLILGFSDDKGLHVVCSVGQDVGGLDYVCMITAYYPCKNKWHEDLETRRKY